MRGLKGALDQTQVTFKQQERARAAGMCPDIPTDL